MFPCTVSLHVILLICLILKPCQLFFFQEMEIDLLILSNIVFEFAFPKDASSYN